MTLGDISLAKGFSEVKEAVNSVVFRKKLSVVFSISRNDPVELTVDSNLAQNAIGTVKTCPTKDAVEAAFKEFLKMCEEQKDKPFYVVYDFGYFTKEDVYRSTMILISFIPEKTKGLTKMIYSTNVQSLKDSFAIPFLFEANAIGDINYNKIRDHVARIQISY